MKLNVDIKENVVVDNNNDINLNISDIKAQSHLPRIRFDKYLIAIH